ncbi:hypothetical protein SASPL_156577 [Salvia splendens]|uniref:PPM-type phosphatase domain-containing protein n=1 Tax=Salvia splendens TaxID=180675 RepID=A0A8X8VWL6_SALSN|nr:hypothetical protein SASPL_156577 [Salvia splendens]
MRRFDEFMDEDGCESVDAEAVEKVPEMHIPLKNSMLKAFRLMDKELKLHPSMDCFCSGSTTVALIKQGLDLIIGNVGDSRAVLATRDKDNVLAAGKPRGSRNVKEEFFALQDEPEVERVWLPNSDSPGLAMARAFGDFCLKDFGSRGNIVASAPGRGTAARALVDCATRAWRLKYPTSKNDDCAAVCLFLEHANESKPQYGAVSAPEEEIKAPLDEETTKASSEPDPDYQNIDSHVRKESSEIVPVVEEEEEKSTDKSVGQSRRSLAECLLSADEDEWSALEEEARVGENGYDIFKFWPENYQILSEKKQERKMKG